MRKSRLSRRTFLAAGLTAAGGLAAVFRLTRTGPVPVHRPVQPGEIGHWIVIHADNTVTLRVAQMEMGQGALTSTAQLLAEELEIDWDMVRTEAISLQTQLTANRPFGRTETDSSLGVALSARQLRMSGAQLRTMLIEAGADHLGVPAETLVASGGRVDHPPSGRSIPYSDLAALAATKAPRPYSTITLKPRSEWKLMGRSVKRLDAPAKVTGEARFGNDIRLPGMKFAALRMSPAFGGGLGRLDASAAVGEPGVAAVLRLEAEPWSTEGSTEDAVAVVADTWWLARKALRSLRVEWRAPRRPALDSTAAYENLLAGLQGRPSRVLLQVGEPEAAMASAPGRHEAVYSLPFLDHAALEPPNFTAMVTDDRFELWGPTQDPEAAMHLAARIAGLSVSVGELHPTLVGGAFGRLQCLDCVAQAVRIASRLKGTPVQVLWSREDAIQHGYYRPAGISRLRAGVDSGGRLVAWSHRVVAHSEGSALSTAGAAELPYEIAHQRIELAIRPSQVPEGPMRGVAFTHTCFATQSFVDELARASKVDTAEFQRRLLVHSQGTRLRRLLDEALRIVDWKTPLSPPRGRGLAVWEEAGSAFVAVAEVTLDRAGALTVDRVVIAGDPGVLLHPDNATAQVEGSVIFGLTSLLYGRITVRDGAVVESNFHDYPVLRMAEHPRIECHWFPDGNGWGGVGEPVVSLVPPAVANAIVAAGGPRIRSLPVQGQLPGHRFGTPG